MIVNEEEISFGGFGLFSGFDSSFKTSSKLEKEMSQDEREYVFYKKALSVLKANKMDHVEFKKVLKAKESKIKDLEKEIESLRNETLVKA